MIPAVRQWLFTTEGHGTYVVLAPTKYLAKLNFRHEIGYEPVVERIGRVRNPRPNPTHDLAFRVEERRAR